MFSLALELLQSSQETPESTPVKIPEKKEKETQTEEMKPTQTETITIVLPSSTYRWEGILQDAPHTKAGMTAMDWAKKKEAMLLEKRAKCPWILEHTRMRNFTLETFNVSRSGLMNGPTPQQPLSIKELDTIPACSVYCTSNAPKIPNPYSRPVKRTPQYTCKPYCHYRYKKEVEDHNLACNTCKA